MAKGISMSELTKAIGNMLDEYSEEVQEVVNDATTEETFASANRVKRAIDQAGIKGRGKYKKSISARTEDTRVFRKGTVYSKAPYYRETHLLEDGHVIKNAQGTYGRTKPKKHWKPAEDELVTKYPDRVKEKIENLK